MRGRRDRGSGSVLVVGAVAALLVVGVAALLLVAVVRATHQARSAADLAALAAAQSLAGGGSPGAACARASVVAAANGGLLQDCRADDGTGQVVVGVSTDLRGSASGATAAWLGLGGIGPAQARARAGPPLG